MALGDRILKIEKAHVVFTSFPDDRPQRLRCGIGIEFVQFPVQLSLQVPREGGNPDGCLVLFRPDTGWRDVTKRFPHTGARFRNNGLRTLRILITFKSMFQNIKMKKLLLNMEETF